MALDDTVYYTNCTYNADRKNTLLESLITLNTHHGFKKVDRDLITAKVPIDFIIEYDGVLTDSCMIGGKYGRPLSKIEMNVGDAVSSLIDPYPFIFDTIRNDGQGILKMYFVLRGTNTHVAMNDFSWNVSGPFVIPNKPFEDS